MQRAINPLISTALPQFLQFFVNGTSSSPIIKILNEFNSESIFFVEFFWKRITNYLKYFLLILIILINTNFAILTFSSNL